MISNRYKHTFLNDLKTNYSRIIRGLRKRNFFDSIEKCPVCLSKDYIKISDKDRYGCYYPLVCCSQCSLLFSTLRIKEDKLNEYYSSIANVIKINKISAVNAFKDRTSVNSYAYDRFHWISRFIKNNYANSVFEFGCSDGANLFPFYKDGSKVSGVDFNESRINVGKNNGLDLYSISSENETPAYLKKNKYDLVIVSHVIEHLSDIYSTIKMLLDNSEIDTYFFFETPGVDYVFNDTYFDKYPKDKNLVGYLQFEHLYFFSEKYLNSLFEIFGLKKIRSNSLYRGLFQKVSNEIPDRLIIAEKISELNENLFEKLTQNESRYKQETSYFKYLLKSYF